MNSKFIAVGIIAVLALVGSIVLVQGIIDRSEPSDLRYDYDETLYYTMQGAVPYGDDHLFKIKAWNKSNEPVSLPMHFKFILSDGTEIIATGVGHRHYNSGTTLNDSGFDSSLPTKLSSSQVAKYECIIHASGYDSKLDGKLVCTDEGWEQYNF